MPITQRKKQSNKRWNDVNLKGRYDHIHLVVPKGNIKGNIKYFADRQGLSANSYIVEAVKERIDRDFAAWLEEKRNERWD
jgi:hypothetical protein